MDDLHLEQISRACVIMGNGLQGAVDALRSVAVAFEAEQVAKAMGVALGSVCECVDRNPFEDIIRAMNEIGSVETMEQLTALLEQAEDMPPIIHKKIPRPPKSLEPINKAKYAANRPPRRARSSCRIIKHR